MPIWSEILAELNIGQSPDFDGVRRNYLSHSINIPAAIPSSTLRGGCRGNRHPGWCRSVIMFKDMADGAERAEAISGWLADHQRFKSHSRHIPRDEIEKHGLTATRLEEDERLQDLALSVFHATTHTFAGTRAVKIVESHTGRAFIKQHIVQPVQSVQLDVAPAALAAPDPARNPDSPQ